MKFWEQRFIFIRLIGLLLCGAVVTMPVYGQDHGCTFEDADEPTEESEITLQWTNPHHRCIVVIEGTTVIWDGNFNTHPLAGGVTPTKNPSSPISSTNDDIGSFTFNTEDSFPYFCRTHLGNMTGVIYVIAAPSPAGFGKTMPINGAVDQSTSPNLAWAESSGTTSYEYCFDDSFDSNCSTTWTDVGSNLSDGISGLANDAIYQWQVRAVNDAGMTDADNGLWFTFSTEASEPGSFVKTNPPNAADGQPTSVNLDWSDSDDAISYEYCIDTSDDDECEDIWVGNEASTTAALTGLFHDTDYFWQVRAVNPVGNTQANDGSWWQFTTQIAPPADFDKTTPSDSQTDLTVNPSLGWQTSSGAAAYEYCFDTTDNDFCNTTWSDSGGATNADLTELTINTVYYWQVRSTNAGGQTFANGGIWWQFRTVPEPPSAFGKTSPDNNAIDQSTNSTLNWVVSSGASEYEYCIDTSDNDACNSAWFSTGSQTQAAIADLSILTTYYWQVRASNSGGTTQANAGTWWAFRTTDFLEGIFDDGFESD
jgi:hypothetical protein